MQPYRLVLVSSNQLSREGLTELLGRAGFEVTQSVACIDELVTTRQDGPTVPDLALIAVDGPADEAADDLVRLRAQYPDSRIAALVGEDGTDLVRACYDAPVDGLLSPMLSSAALVKSLELVLVGERVVSAQLVQSLVLPPAVGEPDCALTSNGCGAWPLSLRETQIVRGLMEGLSNKGIALRPGVTEATVKVHFKSILRKARARNRTQAAIWAINNGLGGDGGDAAHPMESEPHAAA